MGLELKMALPARQRLAARDLSRWQCRPALKKVERSPSLELTVARRSRARPLLELRQAGNEHSS
jgi:hypothetical protein